MSACRKKVLLIINIIVPLLIGLFIYVTKEGNTYISDVFSSVRSEFGIICYPLIIRCYACDFLWAYALFFCIRLSLGDSLKGKNNETVLITAGVIAIALELLQLNKRFPGSYDSMDIVVELFAIFIAAVITTIIDRRIKYEKE